MTVDRIAKPTASSIIDNKILSFGVQMLATPTGIAVMAEAVSRRYMVCHPRYLSGGRLLCNSSRQLTQGILDLTTDGE